MRRMIFYRLATISAGFLVFAAFSPSEAKAVFPIECIAHRGGIVAGHSEETVPTYMVALAGGYQIEGDIRFGRTGYPMMLHNATLGVFGRPDLELADLSVGQAKDHEAPTGDVMATLYEVRVLMLAQPGARAQFELKETMSAAEWTMLATRLDGLESTVTLTSFSLATVRAAQDRGYRTGLLASDDSVTTASGVYAQEWSTIDAASVAAHRAVGVDTQAWTPDTEAAWDTMATAGVTAIITNKPTECTGWSDTR
jgi:hypothetical protein